MSATATALSSHKLKMGYRRTESEPAGSSTKSLYNLRSRFESTKESVSTTPEFGLTFGAKKSTTEVTRSPTPTTKMKTSSGESSKDQKDKTAGSAITTDTGLPKVNKGTAKSGARDKLGLGSCSPRIIGKQIKQSAQLDKDSDNNTLVGLHNAGIMNINKLNYNSSPTSPSLPSWGKGFNRMRSSDSVTTGRTDSSVVTTPTTPTSDYIYTSKVDSKLLSAKTFWSKKSQETEPAKPVELGTDYSKNASKSKPQEEKPGATLTVHNLKIVTDKNSNHEENRNRYSRLNSLTSEDTRSTRSGYSLTKSTSQSSVASSIDATSDLDYVNGMQPTKAVPRRVNSKPPQSIVARRTQLFEKSLDEIGAAPEESEAYRKMKELGTSFTPKLDPSAGQTESSNAKRSPELSNNRSKRKPSTPKPATSGKPSSGTGVHSTGNLLSTGDRLHDKPVEMFKNKSYESATISTNVKPDRNYQKESSNSKPKVGSKSMLSGSTPVTGSKNKPLPVIPSSAKKVKAVDKGRAMFDSKAAQSENSDESKPPPPPPKPPRTFVHKHDEYTPESNFDPVSIPRQDGDGQEETTDDGPVSCQNQAATSSPIPDHKLYTRATPAEPRPYTSLTINDQGSGGDDSLYGSENAYDTLGRCSAASSYDHYDTISQSELDSDLSRPPTLPRRPSNLRHSRPLTTAFSHLDVSKPNQNFHNQLQKALTSTAQTIKETSPTSPSPTKMKSAFKLKYLLPKTRRKTDDMRKAQSIACLTADSLYDAVEILPPGATLSQDQDVSPEIDESGYALPEIRKIPPAQQKIDEAGYTVPEVGGNKKLQTDNRANGHESLQQQNKMDKSHEKIRLKLNQAFSALRKPATPASHLSDGEDEEHPNPPHVLEGRLRHCCSVKEHAIYASAEQIKGFMTRVYAQLYDYAVIVSLRRSPDSNLLEPYVKFKFPPQINVEHTTVPQFCFPDADIWNVRAEYKSEAFSFVLTDVTGTRQYGYCRRVLPPDLHNSERMAEVICVVSPLNATKLYSQLLDEVEKRRMQNALRAEEFLQAVYGRPMPSPGQSVTIKAMSVYEEPESLTFTRSPDAQREGIEYECLLNLLSVSKILKVFASLLLERKIIFIAEKLNWQHTFIPLLPPNLIDIVCAPTPFIVGLLSGNAHLLSTLDGEMEEVLIVDLDNRKFLQKMGDEKTILPKKLYRSLKTALEMAKSESQSLRNLMVSEAFLRFFLETTGSFNEFMLHIPGEGRQFQKEDFVNNAANVPSIMEYLKWFTETQMFQVYTTERENDRNVISGTFEERVYEFKSENHGELLSDSKRFKKFKLFGKKGKK